jgi:hypothetical protein
VGNLGRVEAGTGEHSGQPAHADIALPPLGVVWLRGPVKATGDSDPPESTTRTAPTEDAAQPASSPGAVADGPDTPRVASGGRRKRK